MAEYIMFPVILSDKYYPLATQATSYTVVDPSGWNVNVGNWTSGKIFKAGDILIFNCDSSLHNVLAVDLNGDKGCNASAKARTCSSGKDQIKFSREGNYFICTFPGHCESGLEDSILCLLETYPSSSPNIYSISQL
ncbi:hypothetical protein ACH5RR_010446 [Cinchona calisaya]|uniref:Phytocyanin domain-containing protein n=1 Tax=Cinchona calisaya TaxID=153742 RepID=A0ABD3AIZ5_9GENT